MTTRTRRIYTGNVVLLNGWELRPYAYKTCEGTFVPELSARKHQPGSSVAIVTMDMTCCTKDDAFGEALRQGLLLAQPA